MLLGGCMNTIYSCSTDRWRTYSWEYTGCLLINLLRLIGTVEAHKCIKIILWESRPKKLPSTPDQGRNVSLSDCSQEELDNQHCHSDGLHQPVVWPASALQGPKDREFPLPLGLQLGLAPDGDMAYSMAVCPSACSPIWTRNIHPSIPCSFAGSDSVFCFCSSILKPGTSVA